MTSQNNRIRLVAFDADDTLWDCQSQFDNVEQQYASLLSPWAGSSEVSESLFQTEKANMPSLGFGAKAFTLSLIENAVQMSHGEVSGATVLRILNLGKSLLLMPATPLPGVRQALSLMADRRRAAGYRMVVFTKGELQDQENKLRRSGLWDYFDDVVIVADKDEQAYRHLCSSYGVSPAELLMVGNSFKSDIAPALAVGASAIHIPYHVMWRLECSDTFSHERLQEVERFDQIPPIVAAMV